MTSEKRYPTINGREYYVKIVETARRKRVTVYNADRNSRYRVRGADKNYIVNREKWRGRWLWFGRDSTLPIEEMVQNVLNEAVCIREDKEEEEEEYQEKINRAISTIGELHE